MVNHPNRRRAIKPAADLTFTVEHDHDRDYADLLIAFRVAFANRPGPYFTTDADGLWSTYLVSFSEDERQVHNCHCCKRFIESYGGLVTINADGLATPLFWSESVPDFYRPIFAVLARVVARARVTGRFLDKAAVWGTPQTGEWSHLAVPSPEIYRERALTPFQTMAAIKENYRTVATALSELTAPMLDEALRLLTADTLARSEKFIGPVRWLRALHDRPKGRLGENVLWRAIALAPEGYCHPKASVIGPLLDDIAEGLPFAEIKARFDAKMHPLLYQRPQAAPTAGNVAAAEAIVARLGIAPSLERRFARLDEIEKLWEPRAVQEVAPSGGVFAHLKTKADASVPSVNMPAVTMTWEKFKRTVLPDALAVDFQVPPRGNFTAMLTATNADAPSILKWDRDDRRNPVSWYVYHGGSSADQWRLTAGAWVPVTAISSNPALWGDKPMTFLGEGVILVLEGAADIRTNSGNALFPETLKEELHTIRATIEAYSRTAIITGREEASACGYNIGKGSTNILVRVKSSLGMTTYQIDRLD